MLFPMSKDQPASQGARPAVFPHDHRRVDIPVRSQLRKATRPGQVPSDLTHRTLLRTGMSAPLGRAWRKAFLFLSLATGVGVFGSTAGASGGGGGGWGGQRGEDADAVAGLHPHNHPAQYRAAELQGGGTRHELPRRVPLDQGSTAHGDQPERSDLHPFAAVA